MDERKLDEEVLGRVPLDRRQFVKRIALTTAFVTPVVASFSMDGLTMSQAGAQPLNSCVAVGGRVRKAGKKKKQG